MTAEQGIEEAGRTGGGRRSAVLRPAIALRQLPDELAALAILIVIVAALEPLEVGHGAIEVVAHLLNLRVQRLAFRRLSGEQRKKSAALAAAPFGLRQHAVEVGLLFAGGVFIAFDLIGASRIGAAAIDDRQLAFEAHAHRIGRRLVRRAGGRSDGLTRNRSRRNGRRLGGDRGRQQAGAQNAQAENPQVLDHLQSRPRSARNERDEAMEW